MYTYIYIYIYIRPMGLQAGCAGDAHTGKWMKVNENQRKWMRIHGIGRSWNLLAGFPKKNKFLQTLTKSSCLNSRWELGSDRDQSNKFQAGIYVLVGVTWRGGGIWDKNDITDNTNIICIHCLSYYSILIFIFKSNTAKIWISARSTHLYY